MHTVTNFAITPKFNKYNKTSLSVQPLQ